MRAPGDELVKLFVCHPSHRDTLQGSPSAPMLRGSLGGSNGEHGGTPRLRSSARRTRQINALETGGKKDGSISFDGLLLTNHPLLTTEHAVVA